MKAFHRCASILLCLFMLLLLLCACGNSASTPPAASDGKDYNQYLNSPGYYACTDSAWYSCPGSQIYFLDVGLESPLHPLCAKADCNHNDRETCSSYLPSGAYCLYAWNNTLYYLCGSLEHGGIDLYQMGLDGQDRKLLRNYFSDVTSYSYTANSGGGFLTILWSRDTVNGDAATLYLVSLDDYKADPVVLFSNEDEVASAVPAAELSQAYVLHVNQDWVFYTLTTGSSDDRTTALYGYQISTGETKLLVADNFSAASDLSQQDDQLYWYETDGRGHGMLKRLDLDSGETSLVREFSVEQNVWGTLDDRFLYILGGTDADTAEAAVYDFEGNELQRLSCADLGTPLSYAFSSGDKVFFHSNVLGEHDPICWADKNELEQGKAVFHDIVKDN